MKGWNPVTISEQGNEETSQLFLVQVSGRNTDKISQIFKTL